MMHIIRMPRWFLKIVVYFTPFSPRYENDVVGA
jgi:hypothetical protein